MAKLKDIKGSAIQYLAEDPVEYVGSWSSGGSLNTSRSMHAGFGTQAAAIMATGDTAPPPSGRYTTNVESYDGTSYTEITEVNTGRRELPGIGSSTAGLIAGGYNGPTELSITETWDGSSWTEVNDLNDARANGGAFGTQAAGLYFGGDPTSAQITVNTETWNGSSWTEVNNMNTARRSNKGAGLSTAGLSISGYITAATDVVESWDGTSWTEIAEVNTARAQAAAAGIQTSALLSFGYSTTTVSLTELWNGSSWTEVADGSTGRYDSGPSSAGTSLLTLASGGYNPGSTKVAVTEEWSFPPSTASTLNEGDMWFNYSASALKGYGSGAAPTGTWSSGGALNTGRRNMGHTGAGTQTASLVYGGNPAPGGATTLNENYDGTSWTEVGDLPGNRDQMISFGTTTAAIAADGTSDNGTTFITSTTSWNGTAWTDVPATVNTNSRQRGSAGVQTAGLGAAGVTPGGNNVNNELWDGTSWTEVNNVNTGGQQRRGAGTQTAAILVSVYPNSGIHEQWDGTSWTETTNLNTARAYASTSGSQTNALAFGGNPHPKTNTEHWNGTTWTEVNDLGTGVSDHSATGSSNSALCIAGTTSTAVVANTEEFTAPNAVLTVTTS